MHVSNKVFILVAVSAALNFTGVSSSFHYGNDFIDDFIRDDGGNIANDYLSNQTLRVAKRFYRDYSMNVSDVTVRRVKRDDATFYGHPKTREERWHATFNLNKTNAQLDQAQSLVNLLIKVMDKYLNTCIPIILYDHHVVKEEGILLETFFKVNFYNWKFDFETLFCFAIEETENFFSLDINCQCNAISELFVLSKLIHRKTFLLFCSHVRQSKSLIYME